ncbi:MAG: nucleotidyltransferase domain-containing protein [Candidatus Hydrogenedentes bacterium]|nr:nucleotidyltransferase domain-containing protein [Candidatus Hydrogenedentota bacterium]
MTEAEIMCALDEMVQRIVERFHPDRVILFGSHANGEPSEDSDLDLLIVMPVTGSRRRKANEIDLALADRTVPLDVIVVTPEQFERQKDVIGSVIREAAREGRTVYERAA